LIRLIYTQLTKKDNNVVSNIMCIRCALFFCVTILMPLFFLKTQTIVQLAEIKHGRLAMIAITAFAVQEFVSKVGVVDETPMFFKPLF